MGLFLDNKDGCMWISDGLNCDRLMYTGKQKAARFVISEGVYRIYEVLNEKKLSQGVHMELLVGKGKWQGFILSGGLP